MDNLHWILNCTIASLVIQQYRMESQMHGPDPVVLYGHHEINHNRSAVILKRYFDILLYAPALGTLFMAAPY